MKRKPLTLTKRDKAIAQQWLAVLDAALQTSADQNKALVHLMLCPVRNVYAQREALRMLLNGEMAKFAEWVERH